jgi:DNA-binding protein HU-beta
VADVAHATVWDRVRGVRTVDAAPDERTPVSHISKVTDVITFPARTALGAARLGIRTTERVLGWAAEQVVAAASDPGPSVPAPAAPVPAPVDTESEPTTPDVDPMLGTRTPPTATTTKTTAAKKAGPRKKVPAGQVPLKSAPTPSLTPALEAFDEADDVPEPVAPSVKKAAAKKTSAKKTPAKKTSAKKAPAKKAPSKKAAVLAPALGLSEAEVAETEQPLVDPATTGSVASESETLRAASDPDRG